MAARRQGQRRSFTRPQLRHRRQCMQHPRPSSRTSRGRQPLDAAKMSKPKKTVAGSGSSPVRRFVLRKLADAFVGSLCRVLARLHEAAMHAPFLKPSAPSLLVRLEPSTGDEALPAAGLAAGKTQPRRLSCMSWEEYASRPRAILCLSFIEYPRRPFDTGSLHAEPWGCL